MMLRWILLLGLFCGQAWSADFYTDPRDAGSDAGTSANPWQDETGFNGASFTAGDDHYIHAGTRLTIDGAKVENSTFDGTSGNQAIFGAYHEGSGGSPVVGLNRQSVSTLTCSSGTVTVDTAGDHYYTAGDYVRVLDADQIEYNVSDHAVASITDNDTFTFTISSCASVTTGTGDIVTEFEPPWIEGVGSWGDHSWADDITVPADYPWTGVGATSNADLLTANCDDTAGTADNPDTSVAGLVEFDTAATDYITIQDVGARNTCGRGWRLTATSGSDREGFILDNIYSDNTMLAGLHMRRTKYTMTNSWITGAGQGQKYFEYVGSGTAAIGYRGNETDPGRCVDGLFQGNVVWDTGTWEGFSIVRGTLCHAVLDSIFIDAGELAQLYNTMSSELYVARNVFIGTARAPYDNTVYDPAAGDEVGDGGAFFVDDENSYGLDCSVGAELTEFKTYRSQEILFRGNLAMGDDYSIRIVSHASRDGNGCDGNVYSIAGTSDNIYIDSNVFLDPTSTYGQMHNGAQTDDYFIDGLSAGDKPRIKGNIFASPSNSPTTNTSLANDSTDFNESWEGLITFNYMDSSFTNHTAWDNDAVTTGLTFELSAYDNLETLMNLQADAHANYAQMRYFIRTVLNLDPDDLTSRDYTSLAKFIPKGTAGWGSQVTDMPQLSTFTVPGQIDGDAPAGVTIDQTDLRTLALADPPDIGGYLVDKHPFIRSINTASDGTQGGAGQTWTHPTDCQVGDTVILFTTGGGTLGTGEWVSEYTKLDDTDGGGVTGGVFWDEWENDEGADFTADPGGGARVLAFNFCVGGADDPDTQPPTVATAATGSSTTPDPPAAPTDSGNLARLIVSYVAFDQDGTTRAFIDYPDETTIERANLEEVTTNARNNAVAARVSKTNGDDPGAFTFASADQWVTQTVQINGDTFLLVRRRR